ncbi:MAG: DMT family transporter [Proteobacteria bacterium]|nr:MAG: DMT family transporter [Pseudomonadota bacterium]
MLHLFDRRPDLLPSVVLALIGMSWGVFWLPMRLLDEIGLGGAWATLAVFATALVLLFPVIIARRRRLAAGGTSLLVTGMITGAAFALYATALVLTEVVYTILLFYLTPVWSTLLGRIMLGEKITRGRLLALILGIAGLFVILGFDRGLPLPRNIGDWMALLSGIAWAYGSLRLYRSETASAWESTSAFFAGGLLITLVGVLIPIDVTTPSSESLLAATPWLFLLVAAYLVPSMLVLLWAASRLSPGRVGLLLMGEVVVGVISAALLTDEPFGGRELIGTILIVSAGVIEVTRRQARSTPAD